MFDQNDLNHLTLWARLVVTGCRSMTWVCSKLLQYYNWRQDHTMFSFLADYLIVMSQHLTSGTVVEGENNARLCTWTLAAQRYAYHGFNIWQQWSRSEVEVQADDEWSDWMMPVPSTSATEDTTFMVNVDEEEIDNWLLHRVTQPVCLHHKLAGMCASTRLVGDKWRVTDNELHRVVEISTYACERDDCYLLARDSPHDSYLRIVENYLALHRREYRGHLRYSKSIPTNIT